MNPLDLPLHLVLAGWLFRRITPINRYGVMKFWIQQTLTDEADCMNDIQKGFYPPTGLVSRFCKWLFVRHKARLQSQIDFLNSLGCTTVFVIRKGEE